MYLNQTLNAIKLTQQLNVATAKFFISELYIYTINVRLLSLYNSLIHIRNNMLSLK